MDPNPEVEKIIDKDSEADTSKKFYYADPVRTLFFTAAIAMLVFSPFFRATISLSIIFLIFGITLIVLAGITNRR